MQAPSPRPGERDREKDQTESERSPDKTTGQIQREEGLSFCGTGQFTIEVCEISKNTFAQNVYFRRLQLRRPLYSGRLNPRTPDFSL